jgi:hypothetical protein
VIVHPDMLTSLAAFYPQTCTFTLRAAGVDAHGRPSGAPGNVAGLVSLPCSVNQPARSSAAQEVRRPDMTYAIDTQRVALAGYYPLITKKMGCVIGGVSYNVLSVSHDAQHVSTWVTIERVS